MAQYKAYKFGDPLTAVGAFVVPLDEVPHSAGDRIIVIGCIEDNAPFSVDGSSSAGWAELDNGSSDGNSGGRRTQLYALDATSDAETLTFNFTNADFFSCVVIVVNDYLDSIQVDHVTLTAAATSVACPAIAGLVDDNWLVFRVYSGWSLGDLGATRVEFEDGRIDVAIKAGSNAIIGVTAEYVSGATIPVANVLAGGSGRGSAWTIAIRDSGSDTRTPYLKNQIRVLDEFGPVAATHTTPPTELPLTDLVASIGGVAVQSAMPTANGIYSTPTNLTSGRENVCTQYERNVIEDAWHGLLRDFSTAQDFSGSQIYLTVYAGNAGAQQGNLGAGLILVDASGNWSAFLNDKTALNSGAEMVLAGPGSTPSYSSGVLDWAAVTRYGFLRHSAGSGSSGGRAINVGPLLEYANDFIVGGTDASPIDVAAVAGLLTTNRNFLTADLFGGALLRTKVGFTLGDGVIQTSSSFAGSALAFDETQSGQQTQWFDYANAATIGANVGANDRLVYQGLFTTKVRQSIEITSSAGTVVTPGTTFSGFDVSFAGGVTANNINFDGCYDIQLSGADRCTINGSLSDAALILGQDAAATNLTVNTGSETHAIRIVSAGNYDLSGLVINDGGSPYAAAIDVTATTGTVTIVLTAGDPEPTFQTSGAAVVFSQPLKQLEFTGIQNPSEVRVYDAANPSVEIAGQEVVTSGTFSTTIPSGVAAVNYSILALDYQFIFEENLDVSTDRSIPISQRPDRQYLNP